MIEAGDTIVAGVSGGADSVCLLFVLLKIREKIPFRLAVVHVNHMVRPDAGEDAAYVRSLCKRHRLTFYLHEINMKEYAEKNGLSEEEAGRQIRYGAFEDALKKEMSAGKIAVAHNSNDRAETMLFHLFRGTGLTGASGIKPVNGNIIRPLLCIERKEIEDWLTEKGITYCQDSTNEEDIYTRNRIRHHILLFAEKDICSGAVKHMNQAADNLLEAEEFIRRQTELAKKKVMCFRGGEHQENGVQIHIPDFMAQDEFLQGRILLSCIEEAAGGRKDITAVHIRNIIKLFGSDGSKEIHLPGGLIVYKKYDLGMIYKEGPVKLPENNKKIENNGIFEVKSEYDESIQDKLEIPGLGSVEITVFPYKKHENIPEKRYTKWFDYDKITRSILFRTRKAGDYLTINSRMDHKSLQDYLVNEKVPKDERDCFYVLAEEAHILWVPGHRISEYYKVSDDTRNILQVKVITERRKES